MTCFKFILLLLIVGLPVQSYATENIRKVTVTGKSETVVAAHYAVIKLNIKYVKKEMNQSHTDLMKTISKLTADLNNIGLPDADIKKSLVLQGQEYSWEKDSRILKGYYSECSIDLYVKDINRMAAVYKELANYQSITIQDTGYKRNDESDIRKSEFEKAIQAAKKKAEYMTQTLNAKMGKVHSIREISSENDISEHYANLREREMSKTGGAESGYGNIKIAAVVVIEFELE